MASDDMLGYVTARAVGGGQVNVRDGVEGTIVFRPTVPIHRDAAGDLLRLRYEFELHDGVLAPSGIMATDVEGVQPQPWQWRATFYLSNMKLEPVIFDLPGGTTVNVFDYVSLALAPSIVEVVTDADRRAAEAAEANVAEMIAAFDPGADVDLPDLSLYFENGMA